MTKNQKNAIFISLAVIVITVVLYFFPILKGKQIMQYDMITGGAAMASPRQYKEKFGELPLWTPRIFSGMPTIYIGFERKGDQGMTIISYLKGAYPLYPIHSMIVGMIGMFLLLVSLGVRPYLALGSAMAFGFFSYNLQIIEAGHVTKFMSIMTAPWLLLGFIYLFRLKKIFWGILILAIGLPAQLSSGHIQIIYYFILVAGIYWLYELYEYIRQNALKSFLIKSAIVGGIGIMTLLMFSPNYLPLYSYAKYSIRGPSELVRDKQTKKAQGGLDKDYAYSWSYSRKELLTLVAPGALGEGNTHNLGENSNFYEWLASNNVPNAYQFVQNAPTYWGEQPFVAGGIYIGATIITLFVLALFFDSPIILPFLISALLGLLLALGKHSVSVLGGFVIIFLPILHLILKRKVKMPPYQLGTILGAVGLLILIFDPGGYKIIDLFFDYLPLFNKFRVPSTHLAIVSFAIPVVAGIGVNNFLDKKDWNYIKPRLLYATVITLGGLMFLWLFGSELFTFSSPNDSKFQFPPALLKALKEDRIDMFKKDFLRSIMFSAVALGVLWAYAKRMLKNDRIVTMILALTIMTDNITVARRYLNNDNFVEPEEVEKVKTPKPWVQFLRQDTTYYRVFPVSENPFNDGHTPYYLNTIGGYSPAKLKRYQQLIEAHISRGVPNVLNMLNTKYVITTDTLPSPFLRPIQKTADGRIIYMNLANYGPAWITPKVVVVDIPDQALDTLDNVYSKNVAIIEKKDAQYLTEYDTSQVSPNEYIKLVYYDNMKYVYEYNSPKTRFVTFSEIYYPDWKLYIDGKKAHIFQTNFVLRGAIIPAGKHKVEFKMESDIVEKSGILGYIGTALWFIVVIGSIVMIVRNNKKESS